jgi:hypothetical protein
MGNRLFIICVNVCRSGRDKSNLKQQSGKPLDRDIMIYKQAQQNYIEIAQLIVFFFSFLFLLNLYILYVGYYVSI